MASGNPRPPSTGLALGHRPWLACALCPRSAELRLPCTALCRSYSLRLSGGDELGLLPPLSSDDLPRHRSAPSRATAPSVARAELATRRLCCPHHDRYLRLGKLRLPGEGASATSDPAR